MWNQEKTLSLIEDLHSTPCLWEVKCVDYKNRNKKVDAYEILSKKYNSSATEIEKKIQALKNQFRREHKKFKNSQRSGASPKQINWFGYERLLFLLQGYESRGSRSTDGYENENEDTSINVTEETLEDITEVDNNAAETSAIISSPIHDQHNGDIVNQSSTLTKKTKEFTSPLSKQKRKTEDSNAAEAFKCMKTLADSVSKRDEYAIYEEHIGNKLRNSGRSKLEIAVAQNEIDNICFKLTMGAFSHMHSMASSSRTSSILAYSPLDSPQLSLSPSPAISPQPIAVSHSLIPSHQSMNLQQPNSLPSFPNCRISSQHTCSNTNFVSDNSQIEKKSQREEEANKEVYATNNNLTLYYNTSKNLLEL